MLDSNLSELVVVKRSGQRIPFNGTKIAVAIKYAFDNVYKNLEEDKVNDVYSTVLEYINKNYSDRKTINVEDIQDIIENILKEKKYIDVYNAFSEYRIKRNASRDIFDRKQKHKFVRATEKLVKEASEGINNNPTDTLLNFGKTISNEYSKAYLIDSKYTRCHDDGSIYIHDLDYYVLGTTSNTFIDLSNTTTDYNFFENILKTIINFKKEQYGEHSITSFDYLVLPYLLEKFKYLLCKNIKNYYKLDGFDEYINIKAVENIIYKTNTIYIDFSLFNKYLLSDRVNYIFKLAYLSTIEEVKLDLKLNIKNLLMSLNNLKCGIDNKSVTSISIGTNASKDGIFIRNLYFEVLNELDRLERVTTVYKVDNIDYLEYICKLICLNKNIVITFVNTSYNKKLFKNNNYKYEVEYFSDGKKITDNIYDRNQTSLGRMVVAKTSINLVRIALNSNDLVEFYNNLKANLELVKNELLQEFEYLSGKYKENFEYIYNSNYLIDNEKLENNQKTKKVIRNGTLSIGYAGLKEALNLLNFDSKCAVEIVKFMKEICDKYSSEYKVNFSLRETDEKEILMYFKALDKSIYGSIKDVTDKERYSVFSENFNNESLTTRFKIEKYLHEYSNGGYKEIISIPKNYSYKSLYEILLLAKENDIGYVKVELDIK